MNRIYFIILFLLISFVGFSQVPVITEQPMTVNKCAGDAASISVTATSATTMSYQWKKRSATLVGQTTNTLLFNSLTAADNAGYVCLITNGSGTVTTDSAFVQVTLGAPVITSQPNGGTICDGGNFTFTIAATGQYMNYEWMLNGNSIPNTFANTYIINPATAANSGSYSCNVINACSTVVSNSAILTVNTIPIISNQPGSLAVCTGQSATFSISATGASLSYQWFKENVAISGANASTYTIPITVAGDGTTYSCQITNPCGIVMSNSVSLLIATQPSITAQPYDQTACEGDTVHYITTVGGGTPPFTYHWYHNGVLTTSNSNILTLNNISVTDTGLYFCNIGSYCGTLSTSSAELNIKLKPVIVTQPAGETACNGDNVSFSVKAIGSEPISYQWKKQSLLLINDTLTNLDLLNINSSNAGIYSCFVFNECGSILSDTAILIVKQAPHISTNPSNNIVCAGADVVLAVTVQAPSSQFDFEWRFNGTALPNSNLDSLQINNTTSANTGSYICYVSNQCGADTSNPVTLTVRTSPQIQVQPQNQQSCPGENVSFSTTVTGTSPLTYLWKFNGQALSAEINPTLSINNVDSNDIGLYTCYIENMCGNITTNSATFAINATPVITPTQHQLSNWMGCQNEAVSYIVHVTGGNLTYTWLHNGNTIPGETDSILQTPFISLNDSGQYFCVINNNCGSISTNTATVTVYPSPVIDLGADISICNGDSVSLYGGSDPNWSYAWKTGNGTFMSSIDSAKWIKMSGTYYLKASYNNSICFVIDTIEVLVNSVLSLNLGNDTIVCGNYVLSTGVVATSYNWNHGQSSNPTYNVTQSGYYSVVVSANGGCTSSDSLYIAVYSVPVFSFGPDLTITTRDTLIIVGPHGYNTYAWSTGSVDTAITIIGSEKNPGLYTYALTITDSHCKYSDTINVKIDLNAINEINSEDQISIYPNPGNGNLFLNINTETPENYQLEILDMQGKLVYNEKLFAINVTNHFPLNLSKFSKGIYTLRLKTVEKIICRKLIIN